MKVCGKCHVAKPLSDFSRKGKGHDSRCKECCAAYLREWRAANVESIREKKAAWYARTFEERIPKRRAYYAANREKLIQQSNAWARENREAHQRSSRESKRRHRAAYIATTWVWRRRNYDRYLAQKRDSERRRRLGRDPDAVAYAAVLDGDPCSYCAGPGGTIDHIDASANGGANSWDNLTAACAKCNLQKRCKPLLPALLEL